MKPRQTPRQAKQAEFTNLVTTARLKLDMTQVELATALGVHLRSVQNWEAGINVPRAGMRRHLRVCLSGPEPHPTPLPETNGAVQ